MDNEAIIQLTGGIDSTVLSYYLKEKYQLYGVLLTMIMRLNIKKWN